MLNYLWDRYKTPIYMTENVSHFLGNGGDHAKMDRALRSGVKTTRARRMRESSPFMIFDVEGADHHSISKCLGAPIPQ